MSKMQFRVGLGYDVHQFEDGDRIILGGIRIPFDKKLKGHSDADVLLHAITDALFGALSLGDLGTHFPDTDPEYKGADSKLLLSHAYELVKSKGYELMNLDATVVTELPKLKSYIDDIQKSIAKCMGADKDQISVKATTSEKMGFIGREEGVAAHAVVLLNRVK
jgi:2-C-methyl-D-erythritol 2,4-cyclodiphosphate synthase